MIIEEPKQNLSDDDLQVWFYGTPVSDTLFFIVFFSYPKLRTVAAFVGSRKTAVKLEADEDGDSPV